MCDEKHIYKPTKLIKINESSINAKVLSKIKG